MASTTTRSVAITLAITQKIPVIHPKEGNYVTGEKSTLTWNRDPTLTVVQGTIQATIVHHTERRGPTARDVLLTVRAAQATVSANLTDRDARLTETANLTDRVAQAMAKVALISTTTGNSERDARLTESVSLTDKAVRHTVRAVLVMARDTLASATITRAGSARDVRATVSASLTDRDARLSETASLTDRDARPSARARAMAMTPRKEERGNHT